MPYLHAWSPKTALTCLLLSLSDIYLGMNADEDVEQAAGGEVFA
jgi:hypothetical protein